MRYLLMICSDESGQEALGAEEEAGQLARYAEFGAEMTRRGVLRDGARLRPTSDATTVRVRGGEVVTSDGPFTETKEQIGGYYVVDCENLDEAIDVSSRIPAAAHGTIEVRPIWEM